MCAVSIDFGTHSYVIFRPEGVQYAVGRTTMILRTTVRGFVDVYMVEGVRRTLLCFVEAEKRII